MSILPNLKDLKRAPSVINSTKIFPARVVNNNDPLKLQRVQFRIKRIHRRVVDADLPWALPIVYNKQGNNQVGSIGIPVLGSSILVEYLDDYTSIYRGDFNQDTTKSSELVSTNYPHCYGHIDRSGNKFLVDTENDTITFTHLSGTQINISQAGAVTVIGASSIDLNAATDVNVKAAGNLNVSCNSFNVDSNTTNIKTSGAMLLAAVNMNITASGSIILKAASFVLQAAFNLTPIAGWVTPPVPTPTPPAAVITPPIAATPRTKPTITGFANMTNY